MERQLRAVFARGRYRQASLDIDDANALAHANPLADRCRMELGRRERQIMDAIYRLGRASVISITFSQ